MRTLVTGATGFIGGRLMRVDHRALVRRPAGFPFEVIGDLRDRRSLDAACENMEVIFHCAGHAHASLSGPKDIHNDVNYVGVRNLLEAATEAGVKRFVFLSSVKAMAEPGDECAGEDWPGEPTTAYGRAKQAAEEAVLEAGVKFGMHVVNLRLAMVYGNGGRGNLERMASAIRCGWFPPLPETGNRRSLVHVEDVVEVMNLAARRTEANGKTYIVADSRAYSSREIYQAIRVALAMPPSPRFTVPAGLLRAAGRCSGRLNEIVDRLIGSACFSPTRIELELGWRARIGFAEGLREMLSMPRVLK